MTGLRRVAAPLALAVLLVTSGCSFVTGQGSLAFEASDVSVSQSALEDTGYTESRDTTRETSRNVTVADESRTVTVTNHVGEYTRQIDLGPVESRELARFTVLSTPKVTVAGQGPFNPVGDMSNAELARTFQGEYGAVGNVQLVENRTGRLLGGDVTVSKFSAEARTGSGQSVDVYLHVAKADDGEDFVVAVAVYPQQVDGEREHVNRLLRGIRHETE
jgi:hypothetical protein